MRTKELSGAFHQVTQLLRNILKWFFSKLLECSRTHCECIKELRYVVSVVVVGSDHLFRKLYRGIELQRKIAISRNAGGNCEFGSVVTQDIDCSGLN